VTATGRPMFRNTLARRGAWFAGLLLAMLAAGVAVRQYEAKPRFLHAPREEFVALFVAPPAANSAQTHHEVDQLLAIQMQRSAADVEAAQADRKTEVWQFAEALGLQPAQMRELHALADLADQVEDDVRPYVRAAKHRFLRLRPYEVDARIDPCIDDVRRDLSYPSGHATYGYVMAYLLADMAPERRVELMVRARDFARQRTVCGVHFPSDLEAGRRGAEWLANRFLQSAEYREAAAPATHELRAALGR
jgi:acid phosphatase (class A)